MIALAWVPRVSRYQNYPTFVLKTTEFFFHFQQKGSSTVQCRKNHLKHPKAPHPKVSRKKEPHLHQASNNNNKNNLYTANTQKIVVLVPRIQKM